MRVQKVVVEKKRRGEPEKDASIAPREAPHVLARQRREAKAEKNRPNPKVEST